MAEEKFLMVSLKEKEAKELAQVISNDTSRKILEHLSSVKDDTETGIAKKLRIPISTVHYNLTALQKARLVDVHEFHYSKKGKEVNHYSLANKYVIIAPKEPSESLKTKLRRILPVILAVISASALIQLFIMRKTARTFVSSIGHEAMDAAAKSASEAGRAMPEAISSITCPMQMSYPSIAMWFLLGCIFTIILTLLVDHIRSRK